MAGEINSPVYGLDSAGGEHKVDTEASLKQRLNVKCHQHAKLMWEEGILGMAACSTWCLCSVH